MRHRTLVLSGAAALLLTACGGSSEEAAPAATAEPTPTEDTRTGQEVVEDAVEDLKAAGSVRAAGTFTENGEEAGIDMVLQDDGASGTLTMAGQEIELLVVGEEAYIKAGADFWASSGTPEPFAGQIADQWLLVPAEDAGELGPLSLTGFADELLTPDSGIQEEVGTGEVDGQDVLVVTTEDGSTLSVLTGEDSYPVRIENVSEDEPGEVVLSGFGERQEFAAPADFIDLDQLGG